MVVAWRGRCGGGLWLVLGLRFLAIHPPSGLGGSRATVYLRNASLESVFNPGLASPSLKYKSVSDTHSNI